MLFSVLIAHYNNARYLEKALTSVLCQTHTDWEVIVVDDASGDNFEEIIMAFEKDPRIKVFRNKKNKGCGYTKRKCVEKATGVFAGFLDPDDTLRPDALEIMHQSHLDKPECSIIHSTHYICDPLLQIKRIADYPRPLPPQTPYLLLNDGRVHHFATFKKNNYHRTIGISALNKKAVDQDLYYKLEETGDIFFIDEPLYFYRIHEGSISNGSNEAEAALAHFSIIEEACLRRMKKLKENAENPSTGYWLKLYRTRYYKIRILNSFRRRHWRRFVASSLAFPFVGGFSNLVSYAMKLPRNGLTLLKKSFTADYQIK